MLGGQKRAQGDFTKHVGFFEGKIIAVNPTKEELEKLLGTELEKEIEYTGQDGDGNDRLKLSFRVEDVKTKKIFTLGFILTDKERFNKDNTKQQFINLTGATTWADDESNLPSWFTKKWVDDVDVTYRAAKAGEDDFYSFMKTWVCKSDWFTHTEFFDWKKLMRGNVSQIRELIDSEDVGTVLCLATVSTQEKDGETKEYQQIYNKFFTYGNIMKSVRLAKPDTAEFLTKAKALEQSDRKKLNNLQRFVLNVEDEQYGCKDFYVLEELREYDPSENVVSPENESENEAPFNGSSKY